MTQLLMRYKQDDILVVILFCKPDKMYYSAVMFAFILRNGFIAQHMCKPTACYDLKCYRISTGKDGPHTIYPDKPGVDTTPINVACDQDTDGGGWVIYQLKTPKRQFCGF